MSHYSEHHTTTAPRCHNQKPEKKIIISWTSRNRFGLTKWKDGRMEKWAEILGVGERIKNNTRHEIHFVIRNRWSFPRVAHLDRVPCTILGIREKGWVERDSHKINEIWESDTLTWVERERDVSMTHVTTGQVRCGSGNQIGLLK